MISEAQHNDDDIHCNELIIHLFFIIYLSKHLRTKSQLFCLWHVTFRLPKINRKTSLSLTYVMTYFDI